MRLTIESGLGDGGGDPLVIRVHDQGHGDVGGDEEEVEVGE